jgi:hypothetical protein
MNDFVCGRDQVLTPTLTNKDGYHPNRAVSCRVELLHHSNTLEGTRIQKPGIEPTTTQI